VNPRLRVARDYLLYKLNVKEFVSREKFTAKARIEGEASKEMLEDLGVLIYDKGWTLKLPTDTEFMQKYVNLILAHF
jgi:hypothetical protein